MKPSRPVFIGELAGLGWVTTRVSQKDLQTLYFNPSFLIKRVAAEAENVVIIQCASKTDFVPEQLDGPA